MKIISVDLLDMLLLLGFLVRHVFADCLNINSVSSNDCNLCRYDFYKRTPFSSSSPTTFASSECIQKSSTLTASYYVSPSGCSNVSCTGSINNPFGSLLYALIFASKESDKYLSANIEILIVGNSAFSLENDMSLDGGLYLFRRLDGKITIKPQNEGDTATVYLKTTNFYLFVGGSLTVRNIIFDGSDLNVKNPDCLNLNSLCCTPSKFGVATECIGFTVTAFDLLDDITSGLFNLEFIVDIPTKMLPVLTLTGCTFRNIYSLNTGKGWRTLINFEKSLPGELHIENSTFINCLFQKGVILRTTVTSSLSYYLISISSTELKYSSSQEPASNIQINTTVFREYNQLQVLYAAPVTSMLTFRTINGTVSIVGSAFTSNYFLGNLIELSSYRLNSTSNLSISSSLFTSNILVMLAYMGNNSKIDFISCNFSSNVYNYSFKSLQTNFRLIKSYMSGDSLIGTSFISITDTVVEFIETIIDSFFSTSTQDPVFIYSESVIEASLEAQIQSPDENAIPFNKDRVILRNSTIQRSNMLFIKNFVSIFSLEFYNSYVRNFSTYSMVPFIKVLVEKEIRMEYSVFDHIYNKNNFIQATFGKNLTFFKSFLINSVMCNGFDYFVIANIDMNKTKVICNFTDSVLKNLTISKMDSNPLKFFFFNPYSRLYGFYMTLYKNVTFEDLRNPNLDVSDFLFYYASGHTQLEGCSFKDIANLSIHRFFPRLTNSVVNIISCLYNLSKYKSTLIWTITHDYYIEVLNIVTCLFQSTEAFEYANALTFLNIGFFSIKYTTIRNIQSLIGNALTVKVDRLTNLLVEHCLFYNNSGANDNSADLLLETKNPSTNLNLKAFSNFGSNLFGIINSVFNGSNRTGSISILDNGQLIIENCTFENIKGQYGAILKIGQKSIILIRNTKISGTEASLNGGSFFIPESTLILKNTTIFMSGSKNFGGVIQSSKNSELFINDSSIESCYAEKGGAIWSEKTNLYLVNTKIKDCKTTIQGGHLYIKKSNFTLTNVQLINATSLSAASVYGELVLFYFNNVSIINCTSSLTKGIGSIYIIGVEKTTSLINQFICSNNKAMTGSCLYAQDVKIVITNSTVKENSASSQSVIEVYYSTLATSLYLQNVNFSKNIAEKYMINIFQSEFYLFACVMLNNPSKTSLIQLVESNMTSNKNVYTTTSNLEIPSSKKPYYLSLREDSDCKVIDDKYFGYETFGLMSCYFCTSLSVQNSTLEDGSASTGGAIFATDGKSVLVFNLTISKNSAEKGGGIYVYNSNFSVINITFRSNIGTDRGSDLYIYNDQNTIYSMMMVIRDCKFNDIISTSVYLKNTPVNFSNVIFKGKAQKESQAFYLENPSDFELVDSNLTNLSNMSAFEIYNDYNNISTISLTNVYFADCSSSGEDGRAGRGSFLNIEGFVDITIRKSKFLRGEAVRDGGAISFDCKELKCSLLITNGTYFDDNYAYGKGAAIFTPKSEVSLDATLVNIKNRENDSNKAIYSIPQKMILVDNVSKLQDLNDSAPAIISIDSESKTEYNGKKITSTFETKSGNQFNFGVIIIDKYGNVQTTHDDIIVEIVQSGKESLDIENNFAKVSNGLCIFQNLAIVANSDRIYEFQLNFEYESGSIVKTLNISVKNCSRGEIFLQKRCLECQMHFYSLEYFPEAKAKTDNQTECQKCPLNAECPGGDRIIPESGFWRFHENTTAIIPCLFKKACPNQTHLLVEMNYRYICAEGFSGNLCKECADGYGEGPKGCYKCDGDSGQIASFVIKLLLSISIMVWECHAALSNKKPLTKSLLKVFFFHTAYLISITGLNLNVSEDFRELFGNLNSNLAAVPSDIFSFYCLLNYSFSYSQLFTANLVVRVLIIFFYTFFSFSLKMILDIVLYYKTFKKNSAKRFNLWKRIKLNLIINFIICYRNMYPRVLLSTIVLFKCRDLGVDNVTYLDENPNIECWSGEHNTMIGAILIPSMLLWSFFLPMITFWFIRRNRTLLKKRSHYNKTIGSTTRQSVTPSNPGGKMIQSEELPEKIKKNQMLFFYLTIDFKDRYYYWFCIENLIILCLLLISQITSRLEDTVQRMILFTCFAIIYLLYQKLEPFYYSMNTKIASLSVGISLMNIIFELIGSHKENSSFVIESSKNIIIIANALFYVICIFVIFNVRLKGNVALARLFSKFSHYKTKIAPDK